MNNNPILESFTMRGKTYTIKKGDYILDNGACLQFVAGDNRPLRVIGFSHYSTIILTKKLSKEFPLGKLTKVDETKLGKHYTKYYF